MQPSSIERLAPVSAGIHLPFGERPDGQLIHISEAESGLTCGCVCPACAAPLIARKGTERQHHFAHHDATQACEGALETLLHRLAKQLIAGGAPIWLPSVVAQHADRTTVVSPAIAFAPERVSIEHWLGPTDIVGQPGSSDGSPSAAERGGAIRPDLVLWIHGKALLVEIAVTHPCGPEKVAVIRDRQLAAIEIDLSEIARGGLDRAAIEDLVLRKAPRAWLYNQRLEAAAGELARAAEARAERRRDAAAAAEVRRVVERPALAQRMIVAHDVDAPDVASGIVDELGRAAERVRTAGLERLVGVALGLGGAFAVDDAVWQAVVLDRFAIGEAGTDWWRFSVDQVVAYLATSRCVKPEFRDVDAATAERVRAEIACFMSPREAVEAYLRHIGRELLQRDGDRWYRGKRGPATRTRLERARRTP